jgi:hypothetical protein
LACLSHEGGAAAARRLTGAGRSPRACHPSGVTVRMEGISVVGGFQVANSGTHFQGFFRHNFGEEDKYHSEWRQYS